LLASSDIYTISEQPLISFPAAHALQLVRLLDRWQIGADELLSGTGLTVETLEAPHARISVPTMIELTARSRSLTAEPGIGFYLGLQKRLTTYGYLGFATMSAATSREGLELVMRYAPTVSTALSFSLIEEGATATLVIEELVDLGSVRDVATFSLLVGMRQLGATMTGRDPGRMRLDIPFDEPEYFTRFAHLLPDARFGQPKLRMHFAARALDAPLITPDRAALALAREACERQLAELGFERQLGAQVRRLILGTSGMRSIDDIARALHLSTRTLKRRLAAEGVTYTQLADQERHASALDLLRMPDLTLEDIAQRLDYAALSNFARAFRRWTGQTPAQYRKRRR